MTASCGYYDSEPFAAQFAAVSQCLCEIADQVGAFTPGNDRLRFQLVRATAAVQGLRATLRSGDAEAPAPAAAESAPPVLRLVRSRP